MDGVSGKLKVWIRRVWTLEMVCLGFSDARDLLYQVGSLVEKVAVSDVLRADHDAR